MLRASLGKVVHTVKRAGTYAAKVPPQELHKIAVHVRAVVLSVSELRVRRSNESTSEYDPKNTENETNILLYFQN